MPLVYLKLLLVLLMWFISYYVLAYLFCLNVIYIYNIYIYIYIYIYILTFYCNVYQFT